MTTYVLVDLPHTMIFSGTYLKTLFPEASFLFVDAMNQNDLSDISKYDFVFVAPEFFYKITQIDLLINMVSFQEMTADTVENYLSLAKVAGCDKVYSHNRGKSKHNNEMTDVAKILKKFFDLKEVHVLPEQYTNIKKPDKIKKTLSDKIKSKLNDEKSNKKTKPEKSVYDYRHLIGS